MDIFYDTEFHESGHRNPIDLISIGLVRDDGQKYYAILPDFSIPRAWDNEWIRENVLQHLVPGYRPRGFAMREKRIIEMFDELHNELSYRFGKIDGKMEELERLLNTLIEHREKQNA